MNASRWCWTVFLAASVGASGCADGRPSEARAHAMVESMAASLLLQPLPGSTTSSTRRDFCGGGSVAPSVSRDFSGDVSGVDDAYRELMVRDGWGELRDVEAGGFGATKGDRIVHVLVGRGEWSVSMQQGTETAKCDGQHPGEEVTRG